MRDAYGMGYESPLYARAKREVLRKVLSAVTGLVGWSEWAKSSLVEDYGCLEKDVVVIPPGVDLTKFAPGDRNHSLPRILFVGGDFARKGGNLLLEVFRRRLRGRAELVLVTQGSVASEPGIEVHRNITANSRELCELYASSDIFVLPTLADCYSLVTIEALAAGLPVVVTRIGGIPDLVIEGETGHLLEAGNSDQLGDVLETLIAEPERRLAMGAKARADALVRFDGRENARRLFEFVRSRC
jgi:glycosyltransferase involved in cell wall biosynthesis